MDMELVQLQIEQAADRLVDAMRLVDSMGGNADLHARLMKVYGEVLDCGLPPWSRN